MEDGFRIDPEEVERQITPRTKLIVITNLHNPTGATVADEATLRAAGRHRETRTMRSCSWMKSTWRRMLRAAATARVASRASSCLATSSLTKGLRA